MMRIDRLSVGYGSTPVLVGVDAALQPGTIVGLVGPNGAGKSTLLRTLSGQQPPLAGSVSWRDRPLSSWRPTELACQRAVLEQDEPLPFPFTVAEVVALGRHPHGPSPHDAERVRQELARVDALHLIDRVYPTLSGGERQRVRLARALCQLDAPGLLLLDEPTSAQDVGQRQRFAALVQELAHHQGHLVIEVVHDLDMAARADRLLVVAEGSCLADGPPADVLTAPLLRRVFDLEARVHHLDGRLVVLPADRRAAAPPSVESPCG